MRVPTARAARHTCLLTPSFVLHRHFGKQVIQIIAGGKLSEPILELVYRKIYKVGTQMQSGGQSRMAYQDDVCAEFRA